MRNPRPGPKRTDFPSVSLRSGSTTGFGPLQWVKRSRYPMNSKAEIDIARRSKTLRTTTATIIQGHYRMPLVVLDAGGHVTPLHNTTLGPRKSYLDTYRFVGRGTSVGSKLDGLVT